MTDTVVAASSAPARWAQARRPLTAHDRLTLGLVAVHVLAVLWLSAGGSLFIDDVRAQAYAAGRSWWPFAVESNGTHLAPGARTVDWLMATYAPLAHWPAVLLTTVIATGFALTSAGVVRLAVRAPLVRTLATGLVLSSPLLVPTYAWFRQAMTTVLPLTLVLAVVLLVALAVHRRSRSPLLWALPVHAVALSFSERAVTVPLVVGAVLVALRVPWRGAARASLPFAVVDALFLIAYSSGEYDRAERAQPGLLDAVRKIGRWLLHDYLPSLLGGPLTWRPGNGAYSFAQTPLPLVVLGAAAALVLLGTAARTRGAVRAAAPVVGPALAYAVPVLAMVYVGRLAVVGDVTAVDDLRLLPDAGFALTLALAALADRTLLQRRVRHGERAVRPVGRSRLAGGVLVVAVVLATGSSWVAFADRWHATTVSAWLDALRSGVPASRAPVLPTTVPSDVVPGWVDPGFTTSPLVRLLAPDRGSSLLDTAPVAVAEDGTVRPARLVAVGSSPAVDKGDFCGNAIRPGVQSLDVPLVEPAPYYRGSLLLVGVIVGDATRLDLGVTDRDGRVTEHLAADHPELLRGPHRVTALVPLDAAVASVRVEVLTPNTAGVCVTSAQVVRVETP
ncbi:hypothetical protein LG324_11265 [Phycicoccus jejuensis]|uniref:hypothetical protein n=1 Tax=Phycicoccus jejuensis TaxID=367299 RepID=UPI00384BA845